MEILIQIFTSNRILLDCLDKEKDFILSQIPAPAGVFLNLKGSDIKSIHGFSSSDLTKYQGILILRDSDINIPIDWRKCYFTSSFSLPYNTKMQCNNYLIAQINKVFKKYKNLAGIVKYGLGVISNKIFYGFFLPIGQDAFPLHDKLHEEVLNYMDCSGSDLDTSYEQLNKAVTELKKSRKPSKNKKIRGPEKYFLDISKRTWKPSSLHGSFATGKPHTINCNIQAWFRLGFRISPENFHFDVSPERNGDLNWPFTDCCDKPVKPKKSNHINVYPNWQTR